MEGKRVVEKRAYERKQKCLLLIMNFLAEHGIQKSLEVFKEEIKDFGIGELDLADNITLGNVLTEFEIGHEIKFGNKPMIMKKREIRVEMSENNASQPKGKGAAGGKLKSKASVDEIPADLSFEVVGNPRNSLKVSAFPLRPVTLPPGLGSDDLVLAGGLLAEIKTAPIKDEDLFVAGLSDVKSIIEETVVLPLTHPHLFQEIHPWRSLLLFGPPGCAKTLLARYAASKAQANFFCVSASCLLSKWRGESEKLMKLLFDIASHNAPSIIFFDELDALLPKRVEEHEASLRMRAEFLTAMDGFREKKEGQIFVIAATNNPWNIPEPSLRRFEKKIYVGLPEFETRLELLKSFLKIEAPNDLEKYASMTEGWSGDDIRIFGKESWMFAVRRAKSNGSRAVSLKNEDIEAGFSNVRPIQCVKIESYENWNRKVK
jgi:katanin p60 ATPase-containing subunit A1